MTNTATYVLLGLGIAFYVAGIAVNLFCRKRRTRDFFITVTMAGFFIIFTAGCVSMWQKRPRPAPCDTPLTLSRSH